QERVREALARAKEALGAARSAAEVSRRTRGLAIELRAASLRLRQPRGPSLQVAPRLRAWTCERRVKVTCSGCARPCLVRYRYHFMEGLAPRALPCPHPSCESELTFHIPINSFDVGVLATL